MTTAQDVQRDLKEHFDLEQMRKDSDAAAKREGVPMIGGLGDLMWRLYQAGEWLQWRMLGLGASAKEATDLCFVIGQKSWPAKDPLAVAAFEFDAWILGKEDKPGFELANRIIDAQLKG